LNSQVKPIPIEKLREERFAKVICYPRYSNEELESRLDELRQLGISAVEFSGPKTAHELHILGKGCVSIVLIAHMKRRRVALKARRTDANRVSMHHEVEMLKKANAVNIGPELFGATENFISMELIDGPWLPYWIKTLKGRGRARRIRVCLRKILEDCWKLDSIGLDHGELSRAAKHVIIEEDDRPRLIDFETASTTRRTANVTSISQYLFIGSDLARRISRLVGQVPRERLIRALQEYKKQPNQMNFNKVLAASKL